MLSGNKAKEMRRRASQRRATHKARRTELTLRAETPVTAFETGKGKTKVGYKAPAKPTAKTGKPKHR